MSGSEVCIYIYIYEYICLVLYICVFLILMNFPVLFSLIILRFVLLWTAEIVGLILMILDSFTNFEY